MPERSNGPVSKTGVRFFGPWVRIPLPPQEKMNKQELIQKVKTLEKDILEIKKYLGLEVPRKDLDFKNWKKIERISKKIRKELFKEKYPKLYEKIKRN